MTREKMRIAVIGCGRFSRFFVPLFKAHPVVEAVYVCDKRKDRKRILPSASACCAVKALNTR